MKKYLIFLLISLSTLTVHAQKIIDNLLVIGKRESFSSRILDEKRVVWIYLPSDYSELSEKNYPVVYLLDGGWNFSALTGIVHHLSDILGNKLVPHMIVVGILNTDRTRDLTPTISTSDESGKNVSRLKNSGAGEKFVSFLKNELIPHIDSAYHTSTYRILIGHSLGGLTVMNVLINHTNLFNAYVAIDPSMWWDNKKLLIQAKEAMKEKIFEGKSLFLAIANTMPVGMDTIQVQTDTSASTIHIRSIFLLRNILQQNPGNELNWSYKYYDSDTHGSVPMIAEYDALRFIFKNYKSPDRK
ncbi:MAG TPA: alpha/beta hydrolase-fold protein [Chitinophagaceae bacterium]|jgi:uncharacterized protein|nr:alpha/beta hydrolase-fold protein [Chitinophagaceae bacterium]